MTPEPTTAATATPGGRVWLVTGASRGLGRAFAHAALAAGDRVAALARTAADLEQLAAGHDGRALALPADVTDREAVFAAVEEAVARFGRLDVVVNNAGAMSLGMVEEFTEAEARAQLEVNFFGALWVSQAVAPRLRAQGSGHLVQISSIGGVVTGPTSGLYSASKFALEGMSEALAQELAPFGARLTIVEPGGYWTDLYTRGLHQTTPLPAYAELRAELERRFADQSIDSEPRLAAEAVLALVGSDDPPLRLLLGSAMLDAAVASTRARIDGWMAWEAVSRAAEQAVPPPAGYGSQAAAQPSPGGSA